jgi:hypothetical protein
MKNKNLHLHRIKLCKWLLVPFFAPREEALITFTKSLFSIAVFDGMDENCEPICKNKLNIFFLFW